MLFFLAISVLSFIAYKADNQFFFHLSEVVLQDAAVQNKQNLCLQLLDFSSQIPAVSFPPCLNRPWWIQLYYRFSPFKPDPRSVVRYGTDIRGPCGSRSRVLAALLESQEIPVRLTSLHFQGEAVHTIVEAKCGTKWVILDPTYNLFFQDPRGYLMAADEIVEQPKIFKKTTKDKRGTGVPFHSYYPTNIYTYEDVYPFNWDAVSYVLPLLKGILDKIFPEGEYQSLFHWPHSYRRPKLLVTQITFGFSIFFLMLRFLFLLFP